MLKGKTAVITGSTSGIGLGIARAFAQAGANVVMNGFGAAEEIEALRASIENDFGVRALHHGADMTRPAEITALIDTTVAALGAADIVVNNAGIQKVSPVEEFPVERWDAILAINLSSAFHSTRAAVPHMKKRGWGRIINIASAHGLVASPFKSAYVAAKHGLVGFTKSVALEVAAAGITVNAICPGYVRTALVEAQIADTARARGLTPEQVVQDVMLVAQPTRRFVGIDEIAALAVFLAGESGASMTGAALSIDGGWTAQ